MTEVSSHTPGAFCWIELGTNDQAASKEFYGKLFGWIFEDLPMGPDSSYTTFKLKGKRVGAAYPLDAAKQPGVPPHWMIYVATADADASVASGVALGGLVMAPAFDVHDFGRMAILKDPTGAAISLWQAKTHTGLEIQNEHGAFCWGQLNTGDTARGEAFYTSLFGWTAKTGTDGGMTYTEWNLGGTPIGGMMAMPPNAGGAPSHWLAYFAVDDCDAVAASATALGAKTYVPPTDISNVGRFAVMADPQGAMFALYRA
ncbi:MAG: VOC family protein [Thermoanaerobaculia bacterium]